MYYIRRRRNIKEDNILENRINERKLLGIICDLYRMIHVVKLSFIFSFVENFIVKKLLLK